ncbi:MAG: hypothetical protein K1X83_15095 [Oligoflexia bacterium]|nr:hypothetical protein [Oligoflexia bacterium]
MALLSLNNLAAPLTNKVHLATIFLACLVFVVLRLSSGSLEIRDAAPDKAAGHRPEAAGEDPERLAEHRRALQAAAAASQKRDTDLLGNIIADAKTAEKEAAPAPSGRADSLDEIEKSLGLR